MGIKKLIRRILLFHIHGKNNKVISCDKNLFFLPSGLKVRMKGNNNSLVLGYGMKFRNVEITIIGNNNKVVLGENSQLTSSDIDITGNNNLFDSDKNIKYLQTVVGETGDNNNFVIKTTKHTIREARFYVEEGSSLRVGENSEFKNRGLHVVVNNGYKNKPKLTIGDNVCIAKDCIIRTSDGHTLLDENGRAINEPKDIVIGSNVWIMSRCTILKGAVIPSGCAVGANSLVNKAFDEENLLLVGSPAKILRKNIKWDFRGYNRYMTENAVVEN